MHPALVILASVVFVQTIALLGKERLQEWVRLSSPLRFSAQPSLA